MPRQIVHTLMLFCFIGESKTCTQSIKIVLHSGKRWQEKTLTNSLFQINTESKIEEENFGDWLSICQCLISTIPY